MELVSIALTTFNGAEFLESQLESLMEQDYQNIEVVVCDDCSTDSTAELVEKFIRYFPGHIRLYVNDENLGFVYNFEKAISLCNGAYIALCDQDDIWYPQKVRRMVESIGSNLLITSDMHIVNRFGESDRSGLNKYLIDYCLLGKNRTKKTVWMDGFGVGCSMMFTERLKKMAIPFPRPTAWHELWLAALAYNEKKIGFIDEKLFKHRLYSNSTSTFLEKEKADKKDLYKMADRIIFNETLNGLPCIDREDRYYIEVNSRMFIEMLFNIANYRNDFRDFADPAEYLFKNAPYFRNLILERADVSLKECIGKAQERLSKTTGKMQSEMNGNKCRLDVFPMVIEALQDCGARPFSEDMTDYLKARYFSPAGMALLEPLERYMNDEEPFAWDLFRAIIRLLPCMKTICQDDAE